MRRLALALALLALVACRQEKPVPAPTPVAVRSAVTPVPLPTWVRTPAPVRVPLPVASTPEPTPRYTPYMGDPPPIGNQNGVCVAGNGNGNAIIGAPCAATPTPSPPPSVTPPPLRDSEAWIGLAASGVHSNDNAVAGDLAQYADLCNGSPNPQGLYGTSCPGPGRWGFSNGWSTYFDINEGLPNLSGHDVDNPYHGAYINNGARTCNAAAKIASGNFWKQQTAVTINGHNYTLPDYTSNSANNWMLYTNGGTLGNVANMGWGWNGSAYQVYVNMNSASLLDYVNDVLANCTFASGWPSFDTLQLVFEDNTFMGFQSKTWDIWDRFLTGKNFGTGSIAPFADPTFGSSAGAFVPTNFFNGASHTRTTLITSNDTPMNMAADTSWRDAQASFLGNLKHQNGSGMLLAFNGFLNTEMTLEKNSNTRFAVAEEMLVGCFGTCPNPQTLPYNGPTQAQIHNALNTDLGMRLEFDMFAALYQEVVHPGLNTQVAGMNLSDQSNVLPNATTTTALGTGIHQQNQMWEFAPDFAFFADDAPDMTAEWSDMCGIGSTNTSLAGANCMDVWPFDFIMPSGRITPMPADPTGAGGAQPCGQYSGGQYQGTGAQCTAGGDADPNVLCGGISGLYCAEFNHVWAFTVTGSAPCTAYDRRQWANCAVDLGKFAIIINASGGSKTISAANISSWFPHVGASLGHVLVPCTPLAAYWGSGAGSPVYAMPQSGALGYGTANICSGNTGMDVPSGGTWDNSHALSTITSNNQLLYDGQVLYLTQ